MTFRNTNLDRSCLQTHSKTDPSVCGCGVLLNLNIFSNDEYFDNYPHPEDVRQRGQGSIPVRAASPIGELHP
ncbi:hypothetical protein F7734_46235 [Scytonema sp. UIC 10036]|uniref:hypothetical protein n=1 Tax=Scytonema sp. UIC 10036 TaxID=2304196 RepID=UPI0012DABC25|nr:hypothetical protein [Scytonema sp. UIC 10036]MUG99297.1 hypothetical protein [Scytonema sp. UIC 10036]